jgi:hypothetical protein
MLPMSVENILSEVDAEIARLQKVRFLLEPLALTTAVRGRVKTSPTTTTKKKGKLSKEGRSEIAAGQKERWAARRKATAA